MRAWRRYLPGLDLVAAAVALALLFAAVFSAYRMVAKQIADDATHAAVDIAQTDARFLAEYWTNIADRVTRLHAMAREITLEQQRGEQAKADQALSRLRAALSVSMPGFIHVGAVDAHGILAWSSLDKRLFPMDLHDHGSIRAILQQGHETYIGQRLRGTLSEQPTLLFSAALRSDDGVLIGVSVVSFSQVRAVKLARDLTRYPHDVIALIGEGNSILARSDGMGVGPLDMRDLIPPGVSHGVSHGVSRIFVRSQVPDSDLSVVVGVDEQAVLAETLAFRTKLLIAACVFCLVLILLAAAAVLAGRQARRIRADRLQAVSETARNDLLHEIADQSHDLIAVLDEELHYKFINGASLGVIGKAPSEIIGRTLGCFLESGTRDLLHDTIRSIAADGFRSHRVTLQASSPVGNPAWIEIELSRIDLPAVPGSMRSGWFMIARDVTYRKLAEQELLRMNEDLRALAQNGPGVLYRAKALKNGQSRLEYLSGGMAGFLGYSAEAWITKGFVKTLIHPADLGRYRHMILERIRNGVEKSEYRLRHRDGHYAWVRDTASVARRPDGTYSLIGYAVDITAEKERSAKLEQAQRLLSIGDFASGVGHELGQPLAVISLAAGSAMMALQGDVPEIEAAREKLKRIVAMTDRAGAIIENMRMFGRKEAQAKDWTRLSDSVADAVGVMQDRLEREQIMVGVDIPMTLPALLLPPLLFQQVLINLIANACDAYMSVPADGGCARADGRIIRISAWTGQDEITLRIMDRAGGVAPHVLDRIFEPFFTTKGPHHGAGLGLSVCYGTIRQAGGSLSVSNRDGGAVFDITLPRPQPEDGEPAEIQALSVGKISGLSAHRPDPAAGSDMPEFC